MYTRKNHSSNWIRMLVLVISVALILCSLVGGTLAYLAAQSGSIVNTFQPSEVKIDIGEDFTNGALVKENVVIKNTGDTDAYIRAMVTINWKNGDQVLNAVAGSDYTIKWGTSSKWSQVGEFYYYSDVLPAGDPDPATDVLIKEIKVNNEAPAAGYVLHVEVIASAIQAMPDGAKAEAWG